MNFIENLPKIESPTQTKISSNEKIDVKNTLFNPDSMTSSDSTDENLPLEITAFDLMIETRKKFEIKNSEVP